MIPKLCILALLAIFQGAYGVYAPRKFIKIDSVVASSMARARGACHYSRSEKYGRLQPIMATVRRGGMIHINGFKNDRIGGFVRFSMVPVRKMFRSRTHKRFAFLYSCADGRTYKCNRNETEMCKYDSKNEHYRYYVKVPYVHKNGIYVLGMTRYGSFPSYDVNPYRVRGLGDYFGCVRIRIKGGPLHRKFKPRFFPGVTKTGTPTSCRAKYNDIHCAAKYCSAGSPILTRPVGFKDVHKYVGMKDKKNPVMTMSGWHGKKPVGPMMDKKKPVMNMGGWYGKKPAAPMMEKKKPVMNMSGWHGKKPTAPVMGKKKPVMNMSGWHGKKPAAPMMEEKKPVMNMSGWHRKKPAAPMMDKKKPVMTMGGWHGKKPAAPMMDKKKPSMNMSGWPPMASKYK